MIDTNKVIQSVYEGKVVAILRGVREDKLIPIAEALYEGGIRMIECTFDHSREDCIDANCRMISMLAEHFAGRIHVGAGTVLTVEEVDATVEAGGEFIISPNVDEEVIRHTRETGAVSNSIIRPWPMVMYFAQLFFNSYAAVGRSSMKQSLLE